MSRLTHSTHLNGRSVAVALLTLIFGGLAFMPRVGASDATAAAGGAVAPAPAVTAQDAKNGCGHCAPAGNQLIYMPLAELAEARGGGEIVFNSRSAKEMEVTPTFYKLDGTAVVCDAVRVKSGEIRYGDYKKLLPPERRGERDWGGLALTYYGDSREMWAQFRFMRVNGGGSADEFFIVDHEGRSDVQQAAWWTPPASTSVIALGNWTDAPTGAVLKFGDGSARTVSLAPHATEVVRRESAAGGAESASITITGAPGSVIPAGLIASKDGSFNAAIRFYDTKGAKQPRLFANGLRLAGVAPHMILRNTSDSAIAATPRFIPAAGGEAADPLVLPEVSLAPGETKEVDLSALSDAVRERSDLSVVSVQVENSGAKGSLIGSLYGVGPSGANYETPLRDSGPVRAMTGSYPWRADKEFSTVVYITNISDQDAEFVSQINYDGGGKYLFTPRKLGPGETAVIDPQQVRDKQLPDDGGHRLPKNTSVGQFRWAVRGVTNGKLVLIGRAVMVSRTQHVTTSYSCNDPCPPTYVLYIDGFPGFVGQFQSVYSTAWEYAQYGSGFNLGPYAAYPSWYDDDSLCDYYPSGNSCTTEGITVGDSTIWAFSRYEESYGYDGRDCYDNNNQYLVGQNGALSVVPTLTVGAVTTTSNTLSVNGDIKVRVTIAASSGTVSTNGVTVEVGISDASGPFSTNITPTVQNVNLAPGQSDTYEFNVHLNASPAANRTCKFTGHVNASASSFVVIGNDTASPSVTVLH